MTIPRVGFINRKKELAFLCDLLGKAGNERRLLLLSAPTGIGKTSLVNKALTGFSATPVVHVDVLDHPNFVAEDGEYASRLARCIAEKSKLDSRLPSRQGHETRLVGKALAKSAGRQIAGHLAKKYLGEEAAETLGAVAKDVAAKQEVNKDQDLLVYAGNVMETCPCVVRIENVQKVDHRSLEQMKSLFGRAAGLLGILEYTEGSQNAVSAAVIRAAFESVGVEVVEYRLDKIEPDELVNGLRGQQDILVSVLLRHYEAQGWNLRVLVDVQVMGSRQEVQVPTGAGVGENTTKAVITTMDNSLKFILSMVVVHGGEVDEDLLRQAIMGLERERADHMGVTDVTAALRKLAEIRYIALDGVAVKIAHDSITAALITEPTSRKFQILATGVWTGFYHKLLDEPDPLVHKSEVLHWLAVFHAAAGEAENLAWVLEQCGRAALKSLAPKRLVSLFKQIARNSRGRVDAGRLGSLVELQGEVLYDGNWLDEACECFEQADKLTLPARLMYADACIGTSRAETGFAILEELSPAGENGWNPIWVRANLVRLHGFRSVGRPEAAEVLYRQLLLLKDRLNDRERAFLLRAADVGLSRDEDIPEVVGHLSTAVELCGRLGLKADEAAAHLALCQHLGYAGRLDEATAHLDAAEALAADVWIERYSILNNRAVLNLLRGQNYTESIRLLKDALLLATEDGDRLLILANALGAGIASSAEELERLATGIDGLGDELAKVAHFNLAVFNEEQGDIGLARHHRDRALAFSDQPDQAFWRAALLGEVPVCPGVALRVSRHYDFVFIVHWRLTSETFKGVGQEMAKHGRV